MIYADLSAGTTVFLDASVFIHHFEPNALFGPAATDFLERIENQEIDGVTTTHIAAMVLGSVEFEQDLVNSLFVRFLRRPADPNGLNAFVSALRQGLRDETAIAIILASDEYFARS